MLKNKFKIIKKWQYSIMNSSNPIQGGLLGGVLKNDEVFFATPSPPTNPCLKSDINVVQ